MGESEVLRSIKGDRTRQRDADSDHRYGIQDGTDGATNDSRRDSKRVETRAAEAVTRTRTWREFKQFLIERP